jgi:hypothetical protein
MTFFSLMKVEILEPPHAKPEPGKYHTLGQFYAAIKQGEPMGMLTLTHLF